MDYNDHSSLNGFFNWTATYRWDSDFPIPYGWISPRSKPIYGDAPSNDNPPDLRYPRGNAEILNQIVAEIEGQNKQHRKLMAWMVSNCETNSERELYVQQLQEYINVDVYGKCGPFKCTISKPPRDIKCMSELDLKYKFYLRYFFLLSYFTIEMMARFHMPFANAFSAVCCIF